MNDLPPSDDRLRRLEENQGFTDHAVDQLRLALEAVERRVRDLSRSLAALEDRLARADTPPPGADPDHPSDREPER
ncbi:MAG: hypothetical protein HRU70_03445 [Phycisphaeraceae bacterium]|nr:MAG: hypothetical protein HRU70_03445 [Phycisphaeraceae bacterium]